MSGRPLAAALATAVLLTALGGSPTEGSVPVGTTPRPERALNVVVLTVDSFRADRLRAYGARRSLAPALDAWAAESAALPHAYAVSSWTFPGLVSLFSGRYPARHGYGARGERIADVPLLQHLLADRGYRVPTLNHLTRVPGVQRLEVEARWRTGGAENRAGDLVDWLRSAEARAAPFLAWYHYRQLHLPYDAGAGQEARLGGAADTPALDQLRRMLIVPASVQAFAPADRADVGVLYDAQILDLESYWRELQAALRDSGLEERTIVIVTADHGEELLDHGLVGHASTTEHARLYEEIVHIPMLVHVPARRVAATSCLVSQIDVLPSLLAVLGIEPLDDLDGIDVLFRDPDMPCPDRSLLFESVQGGFQANGPTAETYVQGIRSGSLKLIRTVDAGGDERQELYDLESDPGERRDLLAGGRPPAAGDLERRLDRWVAETGGLEARFAGVESAPPSPRRAAEVAMPLRIVRPSPGGEVEYAREGVLEGVWTGSPAADYVIEYDVGAGDLRTTGDFEVHGNVYRYGPVPVDVWNNLAQLNPWRVRVYPAGRPDLASQWAEFRVRPTREPQSNLSATTGSTPDARRAGR